jgi:hypothetical protein
MAVTVFWDVMPYCLYQHFTRTALSVIRVEDGGCTRLQNFSNSLPDYMASHPRRLQSLGQYLVTIVSVI